MELVDEQNEKSNTATDPMKLNTTVPSLGLAIPQQPQNVIPSAPSVQTPEQELYNVPTEQVSVNTTEGLPNAVTGNTNIDVLIRDILTANISPELYTDPHILTRTKGIAADLIERQGITDPNELREYNVKINRKLGLLRGVNTKKGGRRMVPLAPETIKLRQQPAELKKKKKRQDEIARQKNQETLLSSPEPVTYDPQPVFPHTQTLPDVELPQEVATIPVPNEVDYAPMPPAPTAPQIPVSPDTLQGVQTLCAQLGLTPDECVRQSTELVNKVRSGALVKEIIVSLRGGQ